MFIKMCLIFALFSLWLLKIPMRRGSQYWWIVYSLRYPDTGGNFMLPQRWIGEGNHWTVWKFNLPACLGLRFNFDHSQVKSFYLKANLYLWCVENFTSTKVKVEKNKTLAFREIPPLCLCKFQLENLDTGQCFMEGYTSIQDRFLFTWSLNLWGNVYFSPVQD